MFKRLLPSIILALGLVGAAYAVNITGTNSLNENSVFKVGYIRLSVTDNITALAGGAQATATLLESAMNRVVTVASSGDSVRLPSCHTGASNTSQLAPGVISGNTTGVQVSVVNANATNPVNVFPAVGESINALSANTAFSLATGKMIIFTCSPAGGVFFGNLSA